VYLLIIGFPLAAALTGRPIKEDISIIGRVDELLVVWSMLQTGRRVLKAWCGQSLHHLRHTS
ncbi:MAG: hypothetical protein ACK53L_22105, partial [Pirellulaceae bacterium]